MRPDVFALRLLYSLESAQALLAALDEEPTDTVHALRLVMGWSVTPNGSDVPMWVSAVALVVFAGLAVGLWREMRV